MEAPIKNINLDNKTLGRWPARHQNNPTFSPGMAGYRILYTRGDELIPPPAYRSSFDQAIRNALGNTGALDDATIARAFGVSSTAFACTKYRATTTAEIPLYVSDPSGQRIKGTFIDYTLSVAPNLLANIVHSSLLWGRTYLRKRRNASGWPTGLEWLNPQDVMEQINYSTGEVYNYRVTMPNGSTVEDVPPNEIIYFQEFDPTPGGNGLSRFEVAWRHLNVEQGIVTHAAAFFLNGAQIDGVLAFDAPLSDAQYDKARIEWRDNFRGAQKAHKMAVMPYGATYTPVQGVPKDLAMVELKDSEREDICTDFEVDPVLVGLKGVADALSANSTYGTAEIAHIRRVTLPFLKMLVLPALNKQWAHRDFDKRDFYTLHIDEQAIPQLSESNLAKSDTAINLSGGNVLDYNEARGLVGKPERPDYLTRDPKDALAMWSQGGLTWNHLQTLSGVPDFAPQPYGEVVVIGGMLLPVTRLMDVATKNVETILTPPQSPAPFGGIPGPDTPPALPPGNMGSLPPAPDMPALPAPQPEATLATGKSGVLMLTMPNQPDLISLQGRVRQLVGDVPVEWNEPGEFHITLVYMPALSDEQIMTLKGALADIEIPDLSLNVGSLDVFDNVGEHALHFLIRRNLELMDFEEELYTTCQALGIPMSAYSTPGQFKPHITMGYSTQPIKRVVFHSKLRIQPTEFQFVVDDQIIFQSATQPPQALALPASRSGMPLTLAVSFADNQFIRYAKRALSEALTGQGITAEWTPESQWRYVLAEVDEWTPAAVSEMLQTMDYSKGLKVDVPTDHVIAFAENEGRVYFQVEQDNLTPLWKSVEIDLQARGLRKAEGRGWGGIQLCTVKTKPDLEHVSQQSYPLVANNVTLYLGSEPYHVWNLRGLSPAHLSELKQWRHKVERKGVDIEFNPNVLTGHSLATFIPDALAAGVSVEDTFTIAESVLRGEYEIRAYADTREEFINTLVSLIQKGFNDEVSRRAFSGQMRVALRRSGLKAFRDGFKDGGQDPEGYTADQTAVFQSWLSEQSGYVTDFGQALIKEGFNQLDFESRSLQWANKSLDAIYYRGLKFAAPQKLKRWRRNPDKDSCTTCIANDGQIKTMEEWEVAGLPRSDKLECHGDHCGCTLEDVE